MAVPDLDVADCKFPADTVCQIFYRRASSARCRVKGPPKRAVLICAMPGFSEPMPSEQRAGLESSIPPPKPIPAVQHFNDFARLDQSAPKNDLASPRKEDELDPVRILVKRPMKLSELERYAIEAALQRTGGNVTRAMRQLGIGRTTLYRKLKKYGLR
jgi:DNA-binding NtrC family response regulator